MIRNLNSSLIASGILDYDYRSDTYIALQDCNVNLGFSLLKGDKIALNNPDNEYKKRIRKLENLLIEAMSTQENFRSEELTKEFENIFNNRSK